MVITIMYTMVIQITIDLGRHQYREQNEIRIVRIISLDQKFTTAT